MSNVWQFGDEARRRDAAAWVVRLEAGDVPEDDAAAFDAWLCRAPENAVAFDEALAVSQAYAAVAEPAAEALGRRRSAPPPAGRRAVVAMGGLAAAAAVALVMAPSLTSADTQTYVTAKGEHRTVRLKDGTTIQMNAGTRLSVRMARDARHVVLDQGQAVFAVTHNARRPFTIAAGDRTVWDVGTQFDVRRLDGKLSVTVAEGAVEVRPAAGVAGRAYRLHPGQRLDHQEGAPATKVAAAEPADVMGWRAGRLVYRGQPLSEVVADLNQQFDTPIRIADPKLAAAPISGVLILDNQDAVIRRLALLVPISTVRSDAGVVLRREGASADR